MRARHLVQRIGLLATLIGSSGACAHVTAKPPTSDEPLSAVAPASLAREAARRARPRCRSALKEQLEGGVRAVGDCDAVTSKAARAVVFSNGVRFGVVDHRSVDLASVRLRVSEAVLCRGWPMPAEGRVLRLADIDEAECLLRPYRGGLALVAVNLEGARIPLGDLQADRDGYVSFDFAAVDDSLRRAGLRGLDDARWLEVGRSAWAGTVDLARLRDFLADWHFAWVARGRGSAALWARRHEKHPRYPDAAALAVEAKVDRQQRDYDAVNHGEMPPTFFLQRHVWSPFRRAVEALSTGQEQAGDEGPRALPGDNPGRKSAP